MPGRRVRCSVCGLLHNAEDIRRTRNREYICLDCIANSEGRFVECEECHIVEEKYLEFGFDDIENIDITEINGKHICNQCKNRYYYKCGCCNEYERIPNLLEIGNRFVCPACIATRYSRCEDCGELAHIDDLIETHGQHFVCSRCRNNYIRCEHCNELYSADELSDTTSHGYVCETCRTLYYAECGNCHRYTPANEIEQEEDFDGEMYPICQHCLNENGSSVIYSYHHGEDFVKRTVEEDYPNEELFIGMELEVAGDRNCARKFLRLFKPQNIILMDDSSVRGFEIVTMPMTYKYIMKEFVPQLERGLKFLIEKGFKGHNHGGLHIHVSDSVITKIQAAQLAEILYGSKNDKETWKRIAQRRDENLHWCSFEGNKPFYQISEASVDKPNISGSRHTALNYDSNRTHTYEFRIFNSSLRLDRILKNLECVIALLDYTSLYANAERPTCNTTDFLDYVVRRKIFYPNLHAFLEEKQLVKQHKLKDYTITNEEDERNEEQCA